MGKIVFLCPFGHASAAQPVRGELNPRHSGRLASIKGVQCLTCGRVFIHECHIINRLDALSEFIRARTYVYYCYSEDLTWEGSGFVFVEVEDGGEYTEPVPTGEAYNEMVEAANRGE